MSKLMEAKLAAVKQMAVKLVAVKLMVAKLAAVKHNPRLSVKTRILTVGIGQELGNVKQIPTGCLNTASLVATYAVSWIYSVTVDQIADFRVISCVDAQNGHTRMSM